VRIASLPEVRLARAVVDLGAIDAESKVEAHFTVANDANEAITIENIRGSCSCIAGGDFPIDIGANRTQRVPFFVSTFGKKSGLFSATLVVLVNRGDAKELLEMQVSGDVQVRHVLKSQPSALFLTIESDVQEPEAVLGVQMFQVEFDSWDDIVVQCPDWAQIRFVRQDAELEAFTLGVVVAPQNLTGTIYGEVVVS
jgi:hypothetical protein